jgi:GT2 family glycosyltransferase
MDLSYINTQFVDGSEPPQLSVVTSTYARPDDLIKCVESLKLLWPMTLEVIVADDASPVPVEDALRCALGPNYPYSIRVFRNTRNMGACWNRNRLAEYARASYVLGVDDDAYLWDKQSIQSALEVLYQDPHVFDVALAQAHPDGTLIAGMQAADDLAEPVEIPCFHGYGHVFRRDVFIHAGGYRELFYYNLEEPELCKRMLDKGLKVIYLPDAKIVHSHSALYRFRSEKDYLALRNSIYDSIYNEPFLMMLGKILYKLLMARRHPAFLKRTIADVRCNAASLWHDRKPLRWSTYAAWRRLKRRNRPYRPPGFSETSANT